MTRLERVIECFNEYDKFVEDMISELENYQKMIPEMHLNTLRDKTSILVGELKRYGCRRENKFVR